jgi:hypothetical protein
MCLKLPVSDTLLILVMLVHVVVLMARVGVTGVIVCRSAKG